MSTEHLDPTAGEHARAIREGLGDLQPVTDPTAGEHARAVREGLGDLQPVTDPTDPRATPIQRPATRRRRQPRL